MISWEIVQEKKRDNDERCVKQLSMPKKGIRPGESNNTEANSRGTKDIAVRFKARAPARAYAIWAREETITPNVIAGTFYLLMLLCMHQLTLGQLTHIYALY